MPIEADGVSFRAGYALSAKFTEPAPLPRVTLLRLQHWLKNRNAYTTELLRRCRQLKSGTPSKLLQRPVLASALIAKIANIVMDIVIKLVVRSVKITVKTAIVVTLSASIEETAASIAIAADVRALLPYELKDPTLVTTG